MATEKLDFFSILSESNKLTRSHSRHYLALSVLFILPFSLSLVAFPTLQNTFTNTTSPKPQILLQYNPHQQQPINFKPLLFSFLYTFTLLTLGFSATATITYSLYHGFFGRPVKLLYALKSLSNSLLRLYATFFCAQIIILMILVGVGVIVLTVIKEMEYFGFEIEYSSVSFRMFSVIGKVVLGLGLVCLYLNWVLVPVVVVVESSWGLEPLRRSAYLVEGMRGVVFCLALFYGGIMWSNLFGSWVWSWETGVLKDFMFVVQTVFVSAVLMLFSLHSVAANTVLYMNCKALKGELAGEIVEEFAQEYVSLPFDEEKVPHVVSIVQP